MNFGYVVTFQSLDKGLIERLGPTGFTSVTFGLSHSYTFVNSGIMYHMSFIIIAFSGLFIAFFVLGSFGFFSYFSDLFIFLFVSYLMTLFLDAF